MTKPRNGHPVTPPKNPDIFRVLHRNGELKILDARDRPVQGIIACDMALRPGMPPLMRMNLAAGGFEVVGVPGWQVFDPKAGKMRPVKRIEFTDGGEDFEPAIHMPAPPPAPPPAPATDVPQSETPASEAANAQGTDPAIPAADGPAAGGGGE